MHSRGIDRYSPSRWSLLFHYNYCISIGLIIVMIAPSLFHCEPALMDEATHMIIDYSNYVNDQKQPSYPQWQITRRLMITRNDFNDTDLPSGSLLNSPENIPSISASLLHSLDHHLSSASPSSASASSSASSASSLRAVQSELMQRPRLIKRNDDKNTPSQPLASCGNGVVDAGEECDYNAPGSRECCDRFCKPLPDLRTRCSHRQLGVCQKGVCMTRKDQCSSFNSMVLSFSSPPSSPQKNSSSGGLVSVKGPFQPCDPLYAQLSPQQQRNQQPSLDLSCTLSCEGYSDPGREKLCLDLRLYSNINNFVADGLLCGDQVLGSTMGVCITGQCQPSVCRQLRCNDRGTCIRMDKTGQAACQCDNPYFGSSCQLRADCDGTVDYCGVCNGQNTTCDTSLSAVYNPNFFKSNLFYYVVIPIVTCAIMIVVAVSAVLAVRKRLFDARTGKAKFAGKNRFVPSTHSSKIGVSVRWDEYRCLHDYEPQMPDELALKESDILFKLLEYDDGWAKGYNTRTQEEGVYPVSFTERVESSSAVATAAANNTNATLLNVGIPATMTTTTTTTNSAVALNQPIIK